MHQGTRTIQWIRTNAMRSACNGTRRSIQTLRYLIIDGYSKEGREDLQAGGATTAGLLYAKMFKKCTPSTMQVQCDIIYPADPHFQTPDLSNYHAIGWSGSSLTVHLNDDERIAHMKKLACAGYQSGIPQFGSCFGAQLAVATANGVTEKNSRGKELGIARKIQLTHEGRSHPMYEGKPSVFGGFTSHNDHITHIRPGGLHLATNGFTPVQAVAIRYLQGQFWGLQYHPEYDLREIARLIHCRRKVSIQLGFFRDMDAADSFIEELETLHQDPTRMDIAWRLGIDDDVMDEHVRTCEVRNFIKHLVLPFRSLREDSGGG